MRCRYSQGVPVTIHRNGCVPCIVRACDEGADFHRDGACPNTAGNRKGRTRRRKKTQVTDSFTPLLNGESTVRTPNRFPCFTWPNGGWKRTLCRRAAAAGAATPRTRRSSRTGALPLFFARIADAPSEDLHELARSPHLAHMLERNWLRTLLRVPGQAGTPPRVPGKGAEVNCNVRGGGARTRQVARAPHQPLARCVGDPQHKGAARVGASVLRSPGGRRLRTAAAAPTSVGSAATAAHVGAEADVPPRWVVLPDCFFFFFSGKSAVPHRIGVDSRCAAPQVAAAMRKSPALAQTGG